MRKFFIVLLLSVFSLAASGCEKKKEEKAFTMPYYGTAGYSPVDFPDSSLSEMSDFWEDVDESSETYGVHVDWKDTKVLESAHKNTDAYIVLVLGFDSEQEWAGSVDEFIKEAKLLLSKYPRIKYLSIGNEVNLKYTKNPKVFEKFKSAYKQIYVALKADFPEVKIFTTFQLEALKGKAFLMNITNGNQWSLFKEFEPHMDLAVFTSYPFLEYKTPSKIPTDHYSEILKYTKKPIAISELGWPSRRIAIGYSGSQKEQVEFMDRFHVLFEGLNLEFANWLFINDLYDYETGTTPTEHTYFNSVGLKFHDGRKKDAWEKWKILKDV